MKMKRGGLRLELKIFFFFWKSVRYGKDKKGKLIEELRLKKGKDRKRKEKKKKERKKGGKNPYTYYSLTNSFSLSFLSTLLFLPPGPGPLPPSPRLSYFLEEVTKNKNK